MGRFGVWRPLADNWAAQPVLSNPRLVILHTMVGSLQGTDGMFRSDGYGGSESHWGVGYAGEKWQWQDTTRRAEANGAANGYALSIETADVGVGFPKWDLKNGAAVPAWTPAQCESIAEILAWAHHEHGIPLEVVHDSRPGRRGVAWHALGVKRRSADTVSQTGGDVWSSAAGKVCPGARRIAQIPEIVARARVIAGEITTKPDIPGVDTTVPKEALTMRYANLDNPTGDTPDRSAVLTIDSVGDSLVMPRGARAWLQYAAMYPWAPTGATSRVAWLVINRGGGLPSTAIDPFNLVHRASGAIELPASTESVEIVVQGLPKLGSVGFHIDGIGHA